MLEGQTYNRQLFRNEAWRVFMNTFLNGYEGVINNIQNSCNVINNSTSISIDTGYFLLQGGLLDVKETINVEVPNNTDTFCSLVCEIDLTKDNTELEFLQGSFKIITATNDYPTLIKEDIISNVGIYQMEFARFQKEGNIITDFIDTRMYLDFNSVYLDLQNKIATFDDDFNNWLQAFSNSSQSLLNDKFQDYDNQFNNEIDLLEQRFMTWFNQLESVLQGSNVEEVINHIDVLVEQLEKGLFVFKGYVATAEPIDNLKIDDLWINASVLSNDVPISNVKIWDGINWIDTDDYTPEIWDLWSNRDDDHGYYWFGGHWNLLDFDPTELIAEINKKQDKNKSEQTTLLSSNWILNEETGLYEYNYTTTQYEITDNTDLDIRLDDADLDYIEENGFTIRGKTFDGYATLNSKDKKIEQDLHCTIIYSDSVDITEQEEE